MLRLPPRSAKPEAFAHDISKVACLMQQEGFEYHFIHKSVVEFHAAAFISRTTEDNACRFYVGMTTGKWYKWQQELTFLSQIDRHRYLKHFYVPSALEAMRNFKIDDSDGPVSEETAKSVLNCICMSATAEANKGSGFTWKYEFNEAALGLVANDLVLKSFDRSVGQPLYSQAPKLLTGRSRIGLWDALGAINQQSKGLAAVKMAVSHMLIALRAARKTLALEYKVAEFVAP